MKIDKKTILLLYRTGNIDVEGIQKALAKKMISEEDYAEIMSKI